MIIQNNEEIKELYRYSSIVSAIKKKEDLVGLVMSGVNKSPWTNKLP